MDGDFDQIRIRDFVFFDRLAVLGSITATARELAVPKPTASRWLALLEQRIGQPLVRRTTRHVALTEPGKVFATHAREVLTAVRAAQMATQSAEPRGTIRVSVPIAFGRIVGGSVIAAFRRRLPQVRLQISLQNRRVDLVRDRFDLAIRGGALSDSDLTARRLAMVPMWLYASDAHRDTPRNELTIIGTPGDEALFRSLRVDLPAPSVIVDDRNAVADALVHGVGAAALPGFIGEPARHRGDLVRRDDEPLTTIPVHALYLPSQRGDPRLRVLIDEIEHELTRTLAFVPAP